MFILTARVNAVEPAYLGDIIPNDPIFNFVQGLFTLKLQALVAGRGVQDTFQISCQIFPVRLVR